MKNAADMALAEFSAPNIQLLVKDDGGTAEAARQGAQQALDEGAEIILGPLFAQSVSVVGQLARARNVPVIAFSTDANVASHGVYLLSFLPESDVDRIVQHATSTGKRSFAALIPGQCLRHGGRGRVQAERCAPRRADRGAGALSARPGRDGGAGQECGAGRRPRRFIFIPDGADAVPSVVEALAANGVNTKRSQLLGTGLWDDPRIFSDPALDGGWFAAPDAGCSAISLAATAPASARIRCAPRRWPTTPFALIAPW